ncbi:MAG TPA: LysE family translocator [Hyphomicrobiaceae bacterium]|nr:LysE family translocator [Hyphomicrobiaceae bacterium]
MSIEVIAAFIGTCVILAITPGPNMSLIIANTLAGGFRAGLATLLGTLTGLSILVTIAALGMTSIMVLMSEWFDVIRWAGAIYLIVLGILQLRRWWRVRSGAIEPGAVIASSGGRYVTGVLVALSNPKVLLFLGAFFPQFLNPAAPPGPQVATLAVLFVATLALADLSYTLLVAKARATIDRRRLNVLDGLAGGLLIVGGAVLAAARRPG